MLNQKNPMPLMDNHSDLPLIPEKLYFTIGEVGRLCQLKPHVLRYWEQEFPQLHPAKRKGNRRYYQRKDVLMVRLIRDLLYNQGYTIEGARQKLLIEMANKSVPETSSAAPERQKILKKAAIELEEVVRILEPSFETV